MPGVQIKHVKKALRDVQARWKAAPSAKVHALGYKPGPGEQPLAGREIMARTNHQKFMAMAVMAPSYPPAVDWRKRAGKNFVTAVRDQKSCGSCVAFGTVATVESGVRIKLKKPTLPIDLSEAHLFYCGVPGIPQGYCGTGWWPDA